MQRKHVVCGLIVVALIGGASSPVMAQIFPWWAYDSIIEQAQDRGTLRVGLGLFEPWSACNADGELIGFEIDVATKVAEDMGVEVEFARTNWSYIIPSLVAERFDVIISGMTILPETQSQGQFHIPVQLQRGLSGGEYRGNRRLGNAGRFQQFQCHDCDPARICGNPCHRECFS